VQALTVGTDGTLYVGTIATATTGEVISLMPVDGGVIQMASPGAIQSLALASDAGTNSDVLFAAYNVSSPTVVGNLGAFVGSTLAQGTLRSPCQGSNNSKTYSGIALYKGNGTTYAVGSVNSGDTSGLACIYNPISFAGPIPGATTTQFDAPLVSVSGPTAATNVVISGPIASFLRKDSIGGWIQTASVAANGTGTYVGMGTQLGTDSSALGVGQAVSSGAVFVGGVNATARAVFVAQAGTLDAGTLGSVTDKGVPALVSLSEGYVGQGDALVRFTPGTLSAAATPLATMTNDAIRTSAVLGAGPTDGGVAQGYAVSGKGTLVAFSQGTSTTTWMQALGIGNVLTHPTMDCNRLSKDTRTGVLYVGSDTGKVVALVVDSPRLLDTPGAWPKYQRSAGNAGNDDTANFPTNWPGCP
jgi:hypothetical protein